MPIIAAGSLDAGGGLGSLGLMWAPGIAALATRLIYHRNLRGLGWGLGRARYLALAYLLPAGYALAAYGAVWLVGLAGFQRSGGSLAHYAVLLVGPLVGSFSALGEEIGWRGFLAPQLNKLVGYTRTSLIGGGIWVLYHTPLILFADYHNSLTPLWYQWLCFAALAMSATFVFNWIVLKSGSVWTGVLLHGGHNFSIQAMLDPMVVGGAAAAYWTGEFGAALAIVNVALAVYFWRRRGELLSPLPAAEA